MIQFPFGTADMRIYRSAFCFLVWCWLLNAGSQAFSADTITLVSPNGGENWLAGTTQTIRWTYSGSPGTTVKIQLLKGGSVWQTLASSAPIGSSGSGSYSWTILSYQSTGTDYKIKVTSTKSSSINDSSDNNFTITCHCTTPPFIATSVKHNVLIILDNSNSMDEDFLGEAVGSYSPASKSVVAREALPELIMQTKEQLRAGLMTYNLPSQSWDADTGVVQYHLHNFQYFASYDIQSYCPNPDDTTLNACVQYCINGDNANRDLCTSGCRAANPTFNADYFDEILSRYTRGSEQHNRYCRLAYPKIHGIDNLSDDNATHLIYYKFAYPYYSQYQDNYPYCYSSTYNSSEGSPYDTYNCYQQKTGTSDGASGYSGGFSSRTFSPTDSDYALGYYDFGRRVTWYHVGPTWFTRKVMRDGYLHVPVNDLVDQYGALTSTYTNLLAKLDPCTLDSTTYMNCPSTINDCSHVVNAGFTPTAGTLDTAISYFKGNLSGKTSPIQQSCQKNFVLYVTDGLPSVGLDGRTGTADQLMPDVITKLNALRNLTYRIGGKDYTFDIKTFILGLGLSSEAKTKLDQMAVAGGTAIDGHAYYADDPDSFKRALGEIFSNIIQRVLSGTSVSILSEKAQRGANLMQAVFYPTKIFGSRQIEWAGYFYDYWLYVSRTKFNMREDTDRNRILDLDTDYAITFDFDETTGLTVSRLQDVDGDGEPDRTVDTCSLEDLHPLWEAGTMLFERGYDPDQGQLNPSAINRTIYTTNASNQLVSFDSAHKTEFSAYLGDPSTFTSCLKVYGDNGTLDTASTIDRLIGYVHGADQSGCRGRTVTARNSSGTEITSTWKLQDIVYSTPRVMSDVQYCFDNATSTYSSQHCTSSSECTTGSYTRCQPKESILFAGANDGLLHVFKTGILSQEGLNPDRGEISKLIGTDLGKELWAFAPRHLLPYLRYLPDPNYCHLTYVDLSPYLTTMGNRTILIGGMRLGGATCVGTDGTYRCGAPTDTCSPVTCTSLDTCYNPTGCTGLSSYFALDVTNPESPQFLWEFSHPRLGYSFSGPAIVTRRIDGSDKYFVMFLSGPTTREGSSDQNLHAFVLSLNDQLGIADVYVKDFGSAIHNAFGGRLFTNGLDMNEDGYTDFVFFGFAYSPSSGNWKGGIAKVWTGDKTPPNNEPRSWDFDAQLYFNAAQQPITAKVEFDKCFDRWYLYAGSGRFFFKGDDYGPQNDWIMGVPFVCDAENNCDQGTINFAHGTDKNFCSDLTDRSKADAWYVELDGATTGYYKERTITDSTITNRNAVFFTTTQPTAEICAIGGRSRVWGLNCATGEAISDRSCPGFVVKANLGTLFLQTSTGAIHKIDPTFTFTAKGGKATPWYEGMPPENSPPHVPPSGLRAGKVLHWIEK